MFQGYVAATWPLVRTDAFILVQQQFGIYFVPVTCCTVFNVLNISVGHVPVTFSCVCTGCDFVPDTCSRYMSLLQVTSLCSTQVFYHCKISLQHVLATWLLVSANLNKWNITSQLSNTSRQRIKRSNSHWSESFFFLFLPVPISFSLSCLFIHPS